jgi:cell division protein FtsB
MELLELPSKVSELKQIERDIFSLQTLISFELAKETLPERAKCFVQSGHVFLLTKVDDIRQRKQSELDTLVKKREELRKQVKDLQKQLEMEKR